MQYWLMKSEPDVFSLTDLERAPGRVTDWTGVRNYQARNFMRDSMRPGDTVLYYHSNCDEPGVYGLAEVTPRPVRPDPTQFDTGSEYFDPKASSEKPRWFVVEVCFREHFTRPVTLAEIKEDRALRAMAVAQPGQRLSIQPVEPVHALELIRRGRRP